MLGWGRNESKMPKRRTMFGRRRLGMLVRCKKEGNSLRAMSHKWKRGSRRGDIGEQGCVKVGTRMELSVI